MFRNLERRTKYYNIFNTLVYTIYKHIWVYQHVNGGVSDEITHIRLCCHLYANIVDTKASSTHIWFHTYIKAPVYPGQLETCVVVCTYIIIISIHHHSVSQDIHTSSVLLRQCQFRYFISNHVFWHGGILIGILCWFLLASWYYDY